MRCLYCYQPLENGVHDFHASCSNRLFGQPVPPELPFSEDDLETLALQIIQSQTAVTGVQPKLSLDTTGNKKDKSKRFTIVGLWGEYFLKPPSSDYPQLPEVEDVTMHLAELARIRTAPHSLIRMQSGNLAYITRRMDREGHDKLAMEDMCQLTEKLTEDKYRGSYEQIGKAILKYSANPGLDLVNFFELVIFSFLIGNADMHLKNFSLLENSALGMVLSPAYDLVNTALVNPADNEEMALTLNGKKNRIDREDFIAAMGLLRLEEKQQVNIFHKMSQVIPDWLAMIDISFLSPEFKARYKEIITARARRIL